MIGKTSEVIVYLYRDGSNTPGEITWSLLLNGITSLVIYKHQTGVWFMDYEGLERLITKEYAINLIKLWKSNGFEFMSIPSGFYSSLINKGA